MGRRTFLLAISVVAITCAESPLDADSGKACPEFGQQIELAPNTAKQALLEMMRSEPGKALGFFDKGLVDEMAQVGVEKKKDEYHWTGAFRFDTKKLTYVL